MSDYWFEGSKVGMLAQTVSKNNLEAALLELDRLSTFIKSTRWWVDLQRIMNTHR